MLEAEVWQATISPHSRRLITSASMVPAWEDQRVLPWQLERHHMPKACWRSWRIPRLITFSISHPILFCGYQKAIPRSACSVRRWVDPSKWHMFSV